MRVLIAKQLETRKAREFPRTVYESQEVMLIFATEALYAYYLGIDGKVYELDLDRAFGSLDPVDDPERIAEVHAKAIEFHPELAGLLVAS